jgi:uncharacterized protein (TIGR01370 family)
LKRGGRHGGQLVYTYICVGEAESYRYCWQRGWKRSPPPWLSGASADLHENYLVRFWDQTWQNIIFVGDDGYISRIASAGFDGICLDRCDVHAEIGEHHPQVGAERADVEADMVDFIKARSEFVRTRHTGLGIIN